MFRSKKKTQTAQRNSVMTYQEYMSRSLPHDFEGKALCNSPKEIHLPEIHSSCDLKNIKDPQALLKMRLNSTEHWMDVYDVDFSRTLGIGTFSMVHSAKHLKSGKTRALKVINKLNLNEQNSTRVTNEIQILTLCHHPHIVNLIEYFETPSEFVLVLELKTGGELFDRIVKRTSYEEQDATPVIQQILGAVNYLHNLGIVHRDLKPENILFDSSDPKSALCVADFSLAKWNCGEIEMHTPCGTPAYIAPEIANSQEYSASVDMWALGVIMYTMLCGFPPFYSDDDCELLEFISKGKYSFPDPYWTDVSSQAKDLISHLLEYDARKRYTAEQALNHPWLKLSKDDFEKLNSSQSSKDTARSQNTPPSALAMVSKSISLLRAASDNSVPRKTVRDLRRNANESSGKKESALTLSSLENCSVVTLQSSSESGPIFVIDE